ncbi:hypothetical protein M427DRAFT_32886 [Gonapodya prolifera JEL478]|uniref:Uncharacterized protein n=1 Tax=Gonapodya prolifera (strain JEL478) TaxID=1344416 RepID=A0A139ACX6_GONPJ|nr:hypothetical protein M427DRAFT_32886 [Gonapodya prolifera JEL478]|eukprot:KXS14676.1 hypothetical protein M427DRAFT_32886 [Gonapodya prolifera JEL478]
MEQENPSVDPKKILDELENPKLLKLKRTPVSIWPPPEVVLAQDIVLYHEKDIPEEDVKALDFNTATLSLFHTNGVFNDFKVQNTDNHETPAKDKEKPTAAEAREAQDAVTLKTPTKEKEKPGAAKIKKAQDTVARETPTKEKSAAPDTDLAQDAALETPTKEKETPVDEDAAEFTISEESPTKGKGKSVAQISEIPAEKEVESKAPHPSRASMKKISQDDNGKCPTAETLVDDGEIPQVAGAAEHSDMLASSQTMESLNGGPSNKRSGSQLESPPRKKGRPLSAKKESKERPNVKWTEVIRDNFEVGDTFEAKTSPHYKVFFEIWEDFCDAPVHKKPPTKQTFDRSLIADFVQFVVDHPKYPQNIKLLPE